MGKPGFGLPLPGGGDKETGHLDRLPRFRLPDLDGQEVASSRWAGRVLVLNFLGYLVPTTLPAGAAPIAPLFDELQRTHAEAGLQVVGIVIDNQGAVERFLAEHPVGFPILLGDTDAIELSRRLGNRPQGLPFTRSSIPVGGGSTYESGEMTRTALTKQMDPLLNWSRAAE